MPTTQEKLQWRLTFNVWHGPGFGHRLVMVTQSTGREGRLTSCGSWHGLGIPESVLNGAVASVDAAITEHLMTRYGVQGELDTKWGGEPDPF